MIKQTVVMKSVQRSRATNSITVTVDRLNTETREVLGTHQKTWTSKAALLNDITRALVEAAAVHGAMKVLGREPVQIELEYGDGPDNPCVVEDV